jgi:hypothetical protein
MAQSPDVVFEVAIAPCPPQAEIDAIKNRLKSLFFPLGTGPKPIAVCAPNTRITPNGSVVTVGIWIDTAGSTQDQLMQALTASGFISGTQTAGLFVSTKLIKLKAATDWATRNKHNGNITLGNSINVSVGSAGIVTKVTGTYNVPVLPGLSFTATITERLSLNPPGHSPPLQAHAHSRHGLHQSECDRHRRRVGQQPDQRRDNRHQERQGRDPLIAVHLCCRRSPP